jgi:hypothetical protein
MYVLGPVPYSRFSDLRRPRAVTSRATAYLLPGRVRQFERATGYELEDAEDSQSLNRVRAEEAELKLRAG